MVEWPNLKLLSKVGFFKAKLKTFSHTIVITAHSAQNCNSILEIWPKVLKPKSSNFLQVPDIEGPRYLKPRYKERWLNGQSLGLSEKIWYLT